MTTSHTQAKTELAALTQYIDHVVRDGFVDETYEFAARAGQAGALMLGLRRALAKAGSASQVKSMFDKVSVSYPDGPALTLLQKLVRSCNAREVSSPQNIAVCKTLIAKIEYDGQGGSDYCFIVKEGKAGQLVTELRRALREANSDSNVLQGFGKVRINEPDKAARRVLDGLV